MAKVSVVKCDRYDQSLVDRAVRESLDLLGGIERFVQPGHRVLLKVNALTMKPPEAAVTTHPCVIKAVVAEVKRAGGVPVIGDSSGGMIAGQAPTRQVFEVTGIARAAAESGAELVNFDVAGVVAVKIRGQRELLYIARPVLNADVVISLPKLKTHSAAVFTGAVKNMFGCVPGHKKSEYHKAAPKLKDFSRLLVDIYEITAPALAIMDAIVGMEGNGPSAGNPRHLGLLLASEDPVALDATACSIIGLEPSRVYTTSIAHKRGIGTGTPDRIEILGQPLKDVLVRNFDLPSNVLLETMPGFLVSGLLGLLTAWPEVHMDSCIGCRFCVESCPVQAMEIKGKIPEIDYKKCIACLCCQELCPQKAIKMKQANPLGRAIAGMIERRKRRKRAQYLNRE